MICTTYFLTFFSELIPPTGIHKEKTNSKKRTLKLKNDFYGSPICISTRLLDEPFDILYDTICKYYSVYKRPEKV